MTDANPRTFDLFAPEESVIYPTEIVKVYRNRSALYELKKLEDAINDSNSAAFALSSPNPKDALSLLSPRTSVSIASRSRGCQSRVKERPLSSRA